MQQIKIFKGNEADYSKMEQEVNAWLSQTGARIIQISGNIAPQGAATELEAINRAQSAYVPSDILLVVLYEKN